MSKQDLEEKGKCPYNSFREFDRKLITVTSNSKIFDNYGIEELKNKLITEENVVINCESFENLEFTLYENNIELYDLEKQMDEYYDDKELLELRNIKELDNLRGIYYPDDILLTLEFEDGDNEYIWGKLDGYIADVDKYIVYLLESSKYDFEIIGNEYAVCKYLKIENKEELIIQGILERVEED